jgi:phage tail protein X
MPMKTALTALLILFADVAAQQHQVQGVAL